LILEGFFFLITVPNEAHLKWPCMRHVMCPLLGCSHQLPLFLPDFISRSLSQCRQ